MTKSLTEKFVDAYLNDNEEAIQDIVLIAQQNPNLVASNYYFNVENGTDCLSNQPEVCITITPKVYFDKNKCLYDQSMEPVEYILGEDAGETSSSFYIMNYPFSIIQVENFLLSKGFIKDFKFDQFMK